MSPRLVVAPTAQDVGECVAAMIVRAAQGAVSRRGRFLLALSGGRSPLAAYARLASGSGMPWERTHLFWSDERCVPPDHPDSNFGAANAALLSRVPIPPDQVHRIRGEEDPAAEARRYEALLRRVAGEDLPRLDVILLGLGEDGHTASLFPGSAALDERARLVVAVDAPSEGMHARITFTLPLIAAGRRVVFVVTGAGKARAVARVLEVQEATLPATQVAAASRALWVLDEEAARDLGDALRRAGCRAWARQTRPRV